MTLCDCRKGDLLKSQQARFGLLQVQQVKFYVRDSRSGWPLYLVSFQEETYLKKEALACYEFVPAVLLIISQYQEPKNAFGVRGQFGALSQANKDHVVLGCGAAQIVVRRLAVRQARVRIPARHPREALY
jgi:hypothetical protein